ncbi:hypothetical protein TRFO_02368 [Tritrichomonas foetus]|uniref:DUF3447 domain-containing protein n=1 Tax=Tritrichomonas foetus TaxID=1144522 RepID=A0A1J4J9E0_9EUKA|nr:hypothetical protein TRFO_02368 [Tritrichomonas foetus]|eukprot:OHS93844.1 hypothetical protein TRFO_02368 [Tritrichomonas foetus]
MCFIQTIPTDFSCPPPNDFIIFINKYKCSCSKIVVSSISKIISDYLVKNPNSNSITIYISSIPTDIELRNWSFLFRGIEIFVLPSKFNLEMINKLKIEIPEFQRSHIPQQLLILQEFERTLFEKSIEDILKSIPSLILQTSYEIFFHLLSVCFSMPNQNKIKYFDFLTEIDNMISLFGFSDLKTSYKIYLDQTKKLSPIVKCKTNKVLDFQEIYNYIDQTNDKNQNISESYDNMLKYSIKNDDIDKLQQYASSGSFDFNQEIRLNDHEKLFGSTQIKLLEYTALCGSLKCFKYLILDKAYETPSLMLYAIAGGNSEIIHICEHRECSFINVIEIAIIFHHHEIFEWLIEIKQQSLNINHLDYCIQFFNFDAFYFIFRKISAFSENLINTAVIYQNVILIKWIIENQKDYLKKSNALHYACASGNYRIVELLLQTKIRMYQSIPYLNNNKVSVTFFQCFLSFSLESVISFLTKIHFILQLRMEILKY